VCPFQPLPRIYFQKLTLRNGRDGCKGKDEPGFFLDILSFVNFSFHAAIQTSYASACTRKICALSSLSSDIPTCCLRKVRSSSVRSYKLSSKAESESGLSEVDLCGVEMLSDMMTYCTTVPAHGTDSNKYRTRRQQNFTASAGRRG